MKKLMTLLLTLALAASLTVPALATFTPSVENKGAPAVVSVDGVDAGHIRVTAYGERGTHDAAAVTIKQILEDTHKNVKDAGTLDKLSADVNTLLAKDHPDVKAEDLIVSDLFDVSYVENGAVAPLNQKVTITFKLTVPVENVLLVLHKTSGGDWELMNMDSSKYQKLDKYQVKLTFDSLSPVVFAIDSAEFHVDPNGPSSPQTGEISPVVVIAGMTIVAACAAAYVVRKEKAAR